MAKLSLPKSVKLGYRRFKISKMDLRDGKFLSLIAHIDFNLGEIKIREDLDHIEAATALLHEIFHYLVDSSAALKELFGEATIDELADKVAELFEENPAVIGWIVENLNEY